VLASLHSAVHSTSATVALDIVLAYVALAWLGSVVWTVRDAHRRLDDLVLVVVAGLVGLVPVAGPLLYRVARPAETLDEARARGLEVRTLEQALRRAQPECPVCRTPVAAEFLRCPVCTTRLREPCASCRAPLEPLWQACPYCAGGLTTALAGPEAVAAN
jgi:hypothetical protein